jgi:hypothetical protein
VAALAGLLASLPKLVDLFLRLLDLFKKEDFQAWIAELEGTINKLETAKTVEEKRDAAKGLVRVIRTLH